jgi:hypothetical protein
MGGRFSPSYHARRSFCGRPSFPRSRVAALALLTSSRTAIDNRSMPGGTDARALLESLVGQQIRTITGRPNSVLGIEGDSVIVATGRSPAGQSVPIESVQNGIQRLFEEGEIEVSVPSLGHRSSFVGAVLLTLTGAVPVQTTPPRVRLTDPASA